MFVLAANVGVLPAAAQGEGHCEDESQQLASQQQQVADDQGEAQSLLNQVAPLAASGPGELLAAAAQGALPGVAPDTAASFGAIVVQLGAQIAGWQTGTTQTAPSDYLRELWGQLQTWEGEYASLGPVQSAVPSLVQLGAVFAQLQQSVGKAQGDLALLDNFQEQLQQCQADAGPSPEPAAASPSDGSALCSAGGVSGTSASQCFTLENDAAYAVWAACTEQYFAAEDEAFRTGGDLPINTCDPAWKAAQDAIQQRWGAPQP